MGISEIVLDFKTKSGLRGFVKKISDGFSEWFCGYVLIPKEHKLFGKDYNDIDGDFEVHGGITYGETAEYFGLKDDGFIYGFDCNHYNDDIKFQDLEYTKNQVEKLAKQFKKVI